MLTDKTVRIDKNASFEMYENYPIEEERSIIQSYSNKRSRFKHAVDL